MSAPLETPSGVGVGRKPQEWLQAGDVVRVEISGLGALSNPARNDGIPDTQAHRGASVAGPVASSWLRRSGGALSYLA